MAYKFKDPKLARLAAHHKRKTTKRKEPGKAKHAKKPARRKAAKKRSAPKSLQHIPAELLHELGYVKKTHKRKAAKKATRRRKKASKKATAKRMYRGHERPWPEPEARKPVHHRKKVAHKATHEPVHHHKKATHKKVTRHKATHEPVHHHKKAEHKATRRKTPGGMAHATEMIRSRRLPNLGFAKNYIKRADLTAAEKTKLLKLAHHTYK